MLALISIVYSQNYCYVIVTVIIIVAIAIVVVIHGWCVYCCYHNCS